MFRVLRGTFSILIFILAPWREHCSLIDVVPRPREFPGVSLTSQELEVSS